MTTRVETYDSDRKVWRKLDEIKPGAQPGSFSNTTTDGSREIIVFGVLPDNSKTVVFRLRRGLDFESGTDRILAPSPEHVEIIKELSEGDSFEMDIRSDKSTFVRRVRFTHMGKSHS